MCVLSREKQSQSSVVFTEVLWNLGLKFGVENLCWNNTQQPPDSRWADLWGFSRIFLLSVKSRMTEVSLSYPHSNLWSCPHPKRTWTHNHISPCRTKCFQTPRTCRKVLCYQWIYPGSWWRHCQPLTSSGKGPSETTWCEWVSLWSHQNSWCPELAQLQEKPGWDFWGWLKNKGFQGGGIIFSQFYSAHGGIWDIIRGESEVINDF